jgi:hypothetical protein
MQTVRIFISSPGDVQAERQRCREVIDSLRRRYSRNFTLKPVFWEDLPLQPDMSFQQGVDVVLSEQGVDIAVFILWSRLGSPVGSVIPRPDGTEYRSGTEREFDLMMRSRVRSRETGGRVRPDLLIYTRQDDASFEELLRGTTTDQKKQLIHQKELVEHFIQESFRDAESGVNVGAYFPFDRPVTFSQRLRTHIQELLNRIVGESSEMIWDTERQGPPFLGLESYQAEHADIFFGREEEILESRHILRAQAVDGCAFLLPSGASGSGKSSLARAGILPEIVSSEIDEQVTGWRTLVFTPAELAPDPIRALVHRLADDAVLPSCRPAVLPSLRGEAGSLDQLADALREHPAMAYGLRTKEALAAESRRAGGGLRLLLLIDQLEEIFTTATLSAADRAAFLLVLETFVRSGSIWVIANFKDTKVDTCEISYNVQPEKEDPVFGNYKFNETLPSFTKNAEFSMAKAVDSLGIDSKAIALIDEHASRSSASGEAYDFAKAAAEENIIKEKVRKGLGDFAKHARTVGGTLTLRIRVAGEMKVGWTDHLGQPASRTVKFNFLKTLCCLWPEYGAAGPSAGKSDVNLPVDGKNYSRPFAFRKTIRPGGTERFTLRMVSDASTRHSFRIRLASADGTKIVSPPCKLTYLLPAGFSWKNGFVVDQSE